MAAVPRPALVPLNPDAIPAAMRAHRRWAPWRAEWNAAARHGEGKWEKIPHRAASPQHGLSNKNANGWVTFEEAVAACRAWPDLFAGVGYLMTVPHGIVGVDLDNCRDPDTGTIDDWAAEVIAKLDSYTEVSPSGTGLHAIVAGEVPSDWTNHERGIEIYGGNAPRFLAITGAHLAGSPTDVRAARSGVLEGFAARWRRALTSAEIHDLHLPALIPASELPDLDDLDLPAHARNFLFTGPEPGRDRSGALFATAIALAQAGLSREEVFSLLEANDFAMEVALDHRRQDYDKALRFLWKEAAQRGQSRANELRQLDLDSFEVLPEVLPEDDDLIGAVAGREGGEPAPTPQDVAADFDVLPEDDDLIGVPVPEKRAEAREKPARFALLTAADFVKRKPVGWIIKGVLPRAGLGVVFGASGAGKSFLVLDLVMAIARGTPWRGKAASKGRGVYIVAEGAAGFRNRLEAYCTQHGVDPADVDVRFVTDAPNLMDKADIRELLISLLSYGKLDFVVIDTYARAMVGANENDAKDVTQAVAHCDAIHRKTGAMVLLVHHSGKDPNSGARGSSVLRAAADVEIEVVRTSQYRAATVTKMKDGDDGQEFQFKLAEVPVGRDEDGETITSCVVEHRENAARRAAGVKPLTPTQQVVLRVLDTATELDDASSLHFTSLKQMVVEALPRDPTKKKDNRHRDAGHAIEALVLSGELRQDDRGNVERVKNSSL